jgi:hypothetical protein
MGAVVMGEDRLVVLQNTLEWVQTLVAVCAQRGDAVGEQQHRETMAKITAQIDQLRQLEDASAR